jgi:hypothetical protein
MQLAIKPDYTPIETRTKPLWWQEKGLSYTASGYGRKIPTQYQVKDNNRWKRVYCACFSNSGTCYFLRKGEWVLVDSLD